MGSTLASRIKAAVKTNDAESLQLLLQNAEVRACDGVNMPLNRRRDNALSLAVRLARYELISVILEAGAQVNAVNRDRETPVDVLLRAVLPIDDVILYRNCCLVSQLSSSPWTGVDGEWCRLPDPLRTLLAAGGHGQLIERLVLYAMKDVNLMQELCDVLVNLENPAHFRLSGLLLQVAVWFDLTDCLRGLLIRGVDALNFWRSKFVPALVPNMYHHSPARRRGNALRNVGEYVVRSPPADSYAIQTLKLSFVQDWRAEWQDGGNPSAQFRAGLHLTPDSATIFARAANAQHVLSRIMRDVFRFLPCSCSGPRLRDSDLITTLVLAGYRFTRDEIDHLRLKFDIDFTPYIRYRAGPKPLRHLSRCAVRFSMRCNVYCAVEKIGYLPTSLKNCILIQDDDLLLS